MRGRRSARGGLVVLVPTAAAFGFSYASWLANGRQILDGLTPYPPPAFGASLGWPATSSPPIMLITLPLAKLPFVLAASFWIVLMAAAACATLLAR